MNRSGDRKKETEMQYGPWLRVRSRRRRGDCNNHHYYEWQEGECSSKTMGDCDLGGDGGAQSVQ
jgi:hypothetical protein